jgi:hypothetical protein
MVAAASLASGFGGGGVMTSDAVMHMAPPFSSRSTTAASSSASSSASGSASSSAGGSASRATMAAGIACILLSQLMAAAQLLIDQGSWNAKLQLSPLKVVGCEGVLGVMLTVSEGGSCDARVWRVVAGGGGAMRAAGAPSAGAAVVVCRAAVAPCFGPLATHTTHHTPLPRASTHDHTRRCATRTLAALCGAAHRACEPAVS